jgi:tellurite resistance protein TehA-like permease
MGIGGGIFLLVVGGVLAFGVRDQWSAVNLTNIGYICMAVGVLAIILALVMNQQRTRTAHTEYVERREVGGPPVPPA